MMTNSVAAEEKRPTRKRRVAPPEQMLEPGRLAPRNRRLAAAVAADPRAVYLVGAAAGCAPTTLSQIIGGSKIPSPERCAQLAEVLGIPVEQLFGDEDLVIPA